MKTQKGIIHILLVIALLIVGLGALGYVIYKNQFGAKTIGPYILSHTPGINTTPVPDFINDWEIYSNSEYSFKHPKDLASDTNAGGANAESIRFRYMGEKQKASGRTQTELFDGYMFIVTKIDSTGQKSAKQFSNEAYEATKQNCSNYDNSSISDISTTTINGQIAYQYEVSNCYTDYKNTFMANGDNVYNITQSYTGEEPEYSEYKKTTDQILSTFEFVDKSYSQTTFTHPTLGYSIYIPKGWTLSTYGNYPDNYLSWVIIEKERENQEDTLKRIWIETKLVDKQTFEEKAQFEYEYNIGSDSIGIGGYMESGFPVERSLKTTELTYAGKKGLKYDTYYQTNSLKGIFSWIYYPLDTKSIIKISYEAKDEQDAAIYAKILSTLKFVN